MAWYTCWGTYSAMGPYNNVAMGGSPDSTLHGLDLNPAKGAGYGKGIEFRQEGYTIFTHVNLIGYALDAQGNAHLNQHYVNFGGQYNWYVDTWVSRDNQQSWEQVRLGILVASHNSNQTLAYTGNWGLSNVNWSEYFLIKGKWTHFKIEVRGEEPAQRYQNIYTYEQVTVDSVKPYAIRKSEHFKTLNRQSGFFKVRKNNQFTDKSKQENNKIRKSRDWKNQNKIGEE